MSFQSQSLAEFLDFINKHKNKIRNFNGCRLLEIYQEQDDASTIFSYSHWDSIESLENYRKSKLFRELWATTKTWFKEPPEAWTVDKIDPV